MTLKELWKALKDRDTWRRVAVWMSHDPGKRKQGYKLFGMAKENELPFVISLVIGIVVLIVSFLLLSTIVTIK